MLPFFSLLAACASMTPQPATAVPPNAAVIINSGSTNTRPYRIVVSPDGKALVWVEGEPARKATVSAKAAASFFAHLAAAMPLGKIPQTPCMKSASFGSSTCVQYKGQKSPDLTCGIQGTSAKLAADVASIVSELKVVTLGRSGRRTIVPQPVVPAPPAPTQAPSAAPAPSPESST
jgi:hypothetical protein